MLKSATVDSTACWLVATEPEGNVRWTVSRLCDITEGLTRIEERHVLGATLRCKLDFTAPAISVADIVALRAAQKEASNKPVLCPLWPAVTQYGAARLATSGLYITWEPDFTLWQIHTAATVSGWTPSANARTAPLLWGRFDKMPLSTQDSGTENADTGFTFIENGKASYAITPVATVPTGPLINAETPPLLTFDHDYNAAKSQHDNTVTNERLGYGRDEVVTWHQQSPRHDLSMQVLGSAADIMRLVATFNACGGQAGALWYPGAQSPARLTAAPTAATTITVDNAANLVAHPYICLRNGYGGDVARKITSISGNTLTLNASPGAMPLEAVSLQLLHLGRFKTSELQITYATSEDCAAQVSVIELPTEYSAPSGEVYGSSYGKLAPVVYLLGISDLLGNSWYWTNYESAVTVNSATWQPKQWQWDEISEGLNLDEGDLTLRMDCWSGNPFIGLMRPRRGRQLYVTLYEWDMSSPTATQLWTGTARGARASGRVIEVTARPEGSIMEQRIPRLLDGPSCSNVIYDARCGLSAAARAQPATATAYQSGTVLRCAFANSPTYAAHWFAGGWIVRSNPQGGSTTYNIADSSANISGGYNFDLTLEELLDPVLVPGETITVYPACDCSWARCQELGNSANFAGAPFKPSKNPSFHQIPTATTTGKK